MNRVEELIEELCPDGVEYKKLKDVAEFRGGWGFPEKEQGKTDGKYPFYKVGDMNNSLLLMDKANNYIDEATSKKLKCKPAPKGTIIFPKIGAAMATNKKRILTKDSCYDNNVMGLIANQINDKFLYYFFSTQTLLDFANGTGAVPSLDKKRLEKLDVPLPPLEVQNEIVNILDNFSKLEAELEAELEARKQQYEYYRDNQYKFDQDIVRKKIGELTRVFSAARVHKNEWKSTGVPFYRSSDIISIHNGVKNSRGEAFISHELYENLSAKSGKMQMGDILITGGGSIGIPYIVPTNDPIYVKDGDLICIKKCDEVLPEYLYHYFLTTEFRTYLGNITHNATIPHYTIVQIENTPIPLPPLEEQARIVSILDRFDKLCNDLTEGLPAEIEARRKQYEYYRDLLLTFKPKEKDCSA